MIISEHGPAVSSSTAAGQEETVASGTLGETFLYHAIHSEIQARDYYKQVAERVKNQSAKDRLSKLSSEEEEHREKLEKRYNKLFDKEFQFDPNLNVSPSFSFIERDVFSQAEAMEVVSVAIKAENEAIDVYTAELEGVTEKEDVKLLKWLIKFETNHKRKLQKEYDRLAKNYNWATVT
jgi:rubrerythrin